MKTLEMSTGSLSMLSRAMDIRSLRHDLIAGNISNMDTPHYRSFDLSMKEALGSINGGDAGMALEQSHPSHIQGRSADTDPDALKIHRTPPQPYSLKGDGNTVDLDGEMVKLAENSLMYNALAQMVTKEFQLFTTAIEGK